MTCSRTATSAPPMTVSAMPRSRTGMARAPQHGFGSDFASAFSDIFEGVFGMAGARGGARSGRERGADLRYNMEITLEDAFNGKAAELRIPTSVTCETCSGTGAKPGSKPKACPTCAGAGKIRHAQGFFTLERTCPVVSWPRPGDRRSLQVLLGLGPRHARAHLVGEHSGRRRGRHPHPSRRRRRSRLARRARGRPLYFPLAHLASAVPARRRRSALPRAGLDGDGGARRRIRSADHRGRQKPGEGPGRHPVRPPLPAAGQGYAGAALQADSATCTSRSWSKRPKT